jgi:hypothetical protein
MNSIIKAASSGSSSFDPIVPNSNIASLLDGWIEAERNGVQFPVPFEAAYPMAGYSRKDSAKRYLPKTAQGILYHVSRNEGKGRPTEQITLSIAGLEHLCLMADTPEGHEIREYFRDARSKWELTKQIAPAVAQEVELMHLKVELAKIEAQRANSEHQKLLAENNLLSFRHLVLTTMPEVKQQIILGFEVVEKIEYRDRVIVNNQVVDEGDTINKTGLCDRYDIKTRNGKSDYKRLNALLESAKLLALAWEETTTIQSNYQLRREYLDSLDRHMAGTTQQMHIGE